MSWAAPIENKNVTEQQFNDFIRQKIRRNELDFDGFIFSEVIQLDSNQLSVVIDQLKFTNCKFLANTQQGDESYSLKLSGLNFRSQIDFTGSEFNSNIYIYNCKISDEVIFSQNQIAKHIIFKPGRLSKLTINNSKILGGVYLESNIQVGEVNISYSIISGGLFGNNLSYGGTFICQECSFDQLFQVAESTFTKDISIYKCTFNSDVHFSGVTFLKDALFNNSIFNKLTDFEKSIFNEDAQFYDTRFNYNCTFDEATFHKDVIWIKSKFSEAYFRETKFNSTCDFSESVFNGNTYFIKTKFKNRVRFVDAHFLIDKRNNFLPIIVFENIVFEYIVEFKNLKVSGLITFQNIYFLEKSIFYFQDIEFIRIGRIVFYDTSFLPFYAFFKDIRNSNSNRIFPSVLAFRNCNLKDIYFTNNDMSIFSFYKSVYDNSIFASNIWENTLEKIIFINYKRRNLIFEDKLLDLAENKKKRSQKVLKEYELTEIDGYSDVASLYRRFKVAYDNTKDYEQAGWFYFNEFEMKRKNAKEKSKSKFILYSIYKLFAGYGEKPLWSFYWFLFSSFIFTVINIFNGVKFNDKELFNYDWSFNKEGVLNLISFSWFGDLMTSTAFTISRIIPFGYLPIPKEQFIASTPAEYILSIANMIILLFFLTFIAVGLKRIFRRF